MKKILCIIEFIIILVIIPSIVLTHKGRTDKYGCHTCSTNCERYGYSYEEYHFHNSKSNNSNDSSILGLGIIATSMAISSYILYKRDK